MFFGREDLLERLNGLWNKSVASLVTCRGRRRIGKSTLIGEFARRSRVRYFKLEGLQPDVRMDNAAQLAAFGRQLAEQTGVDCATPKNWFEAFARLDAALGGRTKTVVLLDEISWMGKYDPLFPAELKYAWDNRFSKHPRLIMVLCGSVSSWIDKKIIKAKGFVGRPSLNLIVPELPMDECVKFWGKDRSRVSTRDIVDVLSVTGGVPKYLENVNPAWSADENIRNLCYRPGGLLLDEFNEIFNDTLDENLEAKRKMLVALTDGSRTGKEIAAAIGAEYNGHVVATLGELEAAGFVAKDNGYNPLTGRMSNLCRYRLADNYTRFYLKYVEKERPLIAKDAYRFSSLESLPGWNVILGYQFEALILNNLLLLMRHAHVDRTLLDSCAPFVHRGSETDEGVQIDLLMKSRHALYVVEVKRRERIGEEVVDEVREKIRKIRIKRGMSVFPILVYDGVLSKRVPGDGFFSSIVSSEQLLGMG